MVAAVAGGGVPALAAPPAAAPALAFSAGPFHDLAQGYWALGAISHLAAAGLALTPRPYRFDPYGPETRGSWVRQVAKALLVSAPPAPSTAPFPDVAAGTPWAASVAALRGRQWLFPVGADFLPADPITRQEAFVTLGLALFGGPACAAARTDPLPFADAAAVAPWARGPIALLTRSGYIAGTGNGLLAPQQDLERADAAVLLDRVFRNLLTAGGHRWRIVGVRTLSATSYGNGEGFGGTTATGTPVHLGEAAADPQSLPYGTMLWVTGYDGYGYLPAAGVLERIEDTGRLGPNDIDLYFSANGAWPYVQFGRQAVTAYVLAPTPVD